MSAAEEFELEELDGAGHEEEAGPVHNDTEGVWLISYADLMTLLVGFFALLTSMGSFDEEEFSKVASGTAEYFGGEVDKPFEDMGESIKELIAAKGLEDQVKITIKKTGVSINFEGTLLFVSGSYNLRDGANILMKELIGILDEQASDKKFLIEGHTDDIPINRGIIASNWELSSLRANSVARLFESFEFDRAQILTLGLGETRPLLPNRNEDGEPLVQNQEQNRRVVIKVMNEHPL